jgi:6-phosphogluconolactonase (cycloisomerase 2 family)
MKFLCAVCLLFFAASASAENRFVYLNNQTAPNTITAFQINSDGSLTQLANSLFDTGGNGAEGPLESMAIVALKSRNILYAANGQDGTVSAFTVNPATGNILPIKGSPFAFGETLGTFDMAASPNRRFLFVTNEAETDIHVLAISQETGALSEIPGSPFQANANIAGLKVTANNRFLLAAGNSNNTVEV